MHNKISSLICRSTPISFNFVHDRSSLPSTRNSRLRRHRHRIHRPSIRAWGRERLKRDSMFWRKKEKTEKRQERKRQNSGLKHATSF